MSPYVRGYVLWADETGISGEYLSHQSLWIHRCTFDSEHCPLSSEMFMKCLMMNGARHRRFGTSTIISLFNTMPNFKIDTKKVRICLVRNSVLGNRLRLYRISINAYDKELTTSRDLIKLFNVQKVATVTFAPYNPHDLWELDS